MKTGEPYWGSAEQQLFDRVVATVGNPFLRLAKWGLVRSFGESDIWPVFYQQRVGHGPEGKRLFVIEKLHTLDVDELPLSALAAKYRKIGIDELAQIANIRRHEMSICGPRPLIPTTPEGSRATSYEEIMDHLSPSLQKRWNYVTANCPAGVVSSHGLYQHTAEPGADNHTIHAEMDIKDAMEASLVSNFRLLGQFATLAIQRRLQ